MRTAPELQKTLSDGEALVVFHAVGENFYGFLVTKSTVNIWQLPDARRLRTGLGNFLRALGNYGPNRDLSIAELKSNAWRDAAKETYKGIFTDAHLNESKITSLVIVPDSVLWYLPFEALIPAASKTDKTLADVLPIRYGPTAALAVSNPRPLQRPQHTGILASDLKFAGEQPDRDKLLQELVSAVAGPVVLPEPLPEPAHLVSPLLDGLIVLDDIQGDTIGDPSFLFPRSRSASKEKPSVWNILPFGGPERLMITGFKTEAQQGLKTPRRATSRSNAVRKTTAAGDDIFQSLCNIMSGGTRSVLLTRWRTAGRTNFDLVREFAKESADAPAAEAWQRACLLARENPIDQSHEPRLKHSDETGDMPTADHPFFWAGYLLVDTGPRPEKAENPQAPKQDAAKDKNLPRPVKPGEAGDKPPPPKMEKEPAADKKSENAAAEGAAPPNDETPKIGTPGSK